MVETKSIGAPGKSMGKADGCHPRTPDTPEQAGALIRRGLLNKIERYGLVS